MGKIKVGYLPFYFELYDKSNLHSRDSKECACHGVAHHCAMVYDVSVGEPEAFGETMGVDVVVIRS